MLGIVKCMEADGKYLVHLYKYGSKHKVYHWTISQIQKKVTEGVIIAGVSGNDITFYNSYKEFCESEAIMDRLLIGENGCSTAWVLSNNETAGADEEGNIYGAVITYDTAKGKEFAVVPKGVLKLDVEKLLHIDTAVHNQNHTLTAVEMADTVDTIVGNFVFCKALSQVQLSASLRRLPPDCFRGLPLLNSIALPDGIQELSNGCFAESGLQTITHWPTKLKKIGKEAFRKTALSEFPAVDCLQTIGESAFAETKIAEITIPASVTSIGDSAFYSTEIQEFTLPETVTEIGKLMLYYCKNLHTVHLPPTMESIPEYMFGYCESLTHVDLHEGIRVISKGAFFHSGLKSISLPSSCETVDENAFQYCKDLESVELNENLLMLDEQAFAFCEKLTRLHIPDTVRSSLSFEYLPENLTDLHISENAYVHGYPSPQSEAMLAKLTISIKRTAESADKIAKLYAEGKIKAVNWVD